MFQQRCSWIPEASSLVLGTVPQGPAGAAGPPCLPRSMTPRPPSMHPAVCWDGVPDAGIHASCCVLRRCARRWHPGTESGLSEHGYCAVGSLLLGCRHLKGTKELTQLRRVHASQDLGCRTHTSHHWAAQGLEEGPRRTASRSGGGFSTTHLDVQCRHGTASAAGPRKTRWGCRLA